MFLWTIFVRVLLLFGTAFIDQKFYKIINTIFVSLLVRMCKKDFKGKKFVCVGVEFDLCTNNN